MKVAIDGPAGAGKSTIAKIIAKNKCYIYVDTGAMYRAIAYDTLCKNIDMTDTDAIEENVQNIDITIKYVGDSQCVFLDGNDVTPFLRDEQVGKYASVVAAIPTVRDKLTQLQRKLASDTSVVMDGRDIGTTVLPDAELKVYLTASSSVRAKRRYDELLAKGENTDIQAIEADIIERDYRDMHRELSPLSQAEDAIVVDSSDMSIDQVVKYIIEMINDIEE